MLCVLACLSPAAGCGSSDDAAPTALVQEPDARVDATAVDTPKPPPAIQLTNIECKNDADCRASVQGLSACQQTACDPEKKLCTIFDGAPWSPCHTDDLCIVGMVCGEEDCGGGVARLCDDGNPCTDDSCAPDAGCVYTPNAAACDDGTACTGTDHCKQGVCAGEATGTCECTVDADCAPFEDGNPCNGTLTCQSGACGLDVASIVTCAGDDFGPCAVATCDPASGACGPKPVSDGAQCSDGNPCTQGDTCAAGACVGGALVCGGCATSEDCVPFDDGDPCNGTLACQGGECVTDAATIPVCPPAAGPCVVSACDPAAGGCTVKPSGDGAPCSDGDPCTTGDACLGGACAPGTTPECDDGQACTQDGCIGGKCVHLQANDGTPCDDADACTGGDACLNGACASGPPAACDDGNPCTADGCDPELGCAHLPNDASPCDDGNPCTTGEACLAGQCTAGNNTCSCATDAGCAAFEDGNLCNGTLHCAAGACVVDPATIVTCAAGGGCTLTACDPASGACAPIAAPKGTPCDDGDPCTEADACAAGTCAGVAVACDDGNACTSDACNPTAGCKSTPAAGPCDDGNPCTAGDACGPTGLCAPGPNACSCQKDADCAQQQGGANLCAGTLMCQVGPAGGKCIVKPGSAIVCDTSTDGPCGKTVCVPAIAACVKVTAPDGSPCSDGNACTQLDTCQGGACAPASAPSCDDGNPCTADACVPATGCQHVAIAVPCDDADPCTAGDHCSGGACVSGANQCACAKDADCADTEDGDLCNGTMHCLGGVCQLDASTVVTCPAPASPCLGAKCVAATGQCVTVQAANGLPCDDGTACTVLDHCAEGACVAGDAVSCDDGTPCTTDSCNPVSGCGHAPVENGASCSDGNPCTGNDHCTGGLCGGQTGDGDGPCGCNDDGDCAPLDDGNACNGTWACVLGHCAIKSGSVVSCPPAIGKCLVSVCVPATGACAIVTVVDGLACDDGDPCTWATSCKAGACVGAAVQCDDGDVCTADACTATGCAFSPVSDGVPCDDGSSCTTGDTCAGGECTAGTAACACSGDADCVGSPTNLCEGLLVCVAGACIPDPGTIPTCGGPSPLPCHAPPTCDPATGQCVAQTLDNGTPCDDGSMCTVGETCQGGACQGGLVKPCDDANPCTSDACAPGAGCTHSPKGGGCNDGNACTKEDSCKAGVCSGKFDNDAPGCGNGDGGGGG